MTVLECRRGETSTRGSKAACVGGGNAGARGAGTLQPGGTRARQTDTLQVGLAVLAVRQELPLRTDWARHNPSMTSDKVGGGGGYEQWVRYSHDTTNNMITIITMMMMMIIVIHMIDEDKYDDIWYCEDRCNFGIYGPEGALAPPSNFQ